jgi:transcriptional regulator with XRE-family HTH domain
LPRRLIAIALGVSVQSVSNWERGICAPRADRVGTLAHYLKCSTDDLFEAIDD